MFKKITALLLIIIFILSATYLTLRYGLSKENIAFPTQDHAHFRIKYVFNGQEEDFGSPRYQTDYTKDICNGSLTTSPLHFHDNKPDYQHLHWANVTGGQFLKFYGLNYIGGLDGYMGFKLDSLPSVTPVPIYGKDLPKPRSEDQFWIYTGKENLDSLGNATGDWSFEKKTFDNFKDNSFEQFFGIESQVRKDIQRYGALESFGDIMTSIKVLAHNEVEHTTDAEAQKHLIEIGQQKNTERLNNKIVDNTSSNSSFGNDSSTQPQLDPVTGQELKSINNFLGDVVIFVQPTEPTADQIQARFKNMVKLDKSSCGG